MQRAQGVLKTSLLTTATLIISLYLPLVFMIYTPTWYTFNCHFHSRCEILGAEKIQQSAANLSAYFMHLESLQAIWSQRERLHLAEVRDLYDRLLGFFALALILAGCCWEKHRLKKAAVINLSVLASLLLLLPIFGFFWRNIFHAALFSNELWQTSRSDITWYLTPRVLFRNSLILMIAFAAALNTTWLFLSRGELAEKL